MLFSLSRTKGLMLAGALALAGLVPHLAFAQAGAQGRPDATNVQMVSVPETYCRSIDNTDMTGQDYYFSAADVTAKSGKVIQSHNGGNCCTAAAPWNGTACQAVPTCTNDKDLVGWSCVATSDSCARVGMSLINGACGVAVPPGPPYSVADLVGKCRKDNSLRYSRVLTIESGPVYKTKTTKTKGIGAGNTSTLYYNMVYDAVSWFTYIEGRQIRFYPYGMTDTDYQGNVYGWTGC